MALKLENGWSLEIDLKEDEVLADLLGAWLVGADDDTRGAAA
jgi:hypothetical protein